MKRIMLFMSIFSILLLSSSRAADNKNESASRLKLYSDFCSEKTSEFHKIIDKKNIGDQLIYVLTKEGQKNHFLRASIALDNIEAIPEAERILAANVLMMARYNHMEQIKKLLMFKSKNQITEGYRTYFDGLLSVYLKDLKTGAENISRALDILPYLDENMLLTAYYIGVNTSNEPKGFQSYVDNLSESNALKYLLQANELLMLGG